MKIIETFRDGIQGINTFIPTNTKIDILNTLLKVGFNTVEVGSFVSPKSIPQLADTHEVIKKLNKEDSISKIMVLVASVTGAEKAIQHDIIDTVSFPYSASPTFLRKNIKLSPVEALTEIKKIKEICDKKNKNLVVYLAMGLGNPYGEEWKLELILEEIKNLFDLGIRSIPISDITGESNSDRIRAIFTSVGSEFPQIESGLHLHTGQTALNQKLEAAMDSGCESFDCVTGGLGGCPMTGYELLSNLDTSDFIQFCEKKYIKTNINLEYFNLAKQKIQLLKYKYH